MYCSPLIYNACFGASRTPETSGIPNASVLYEGDFLTSLLVVGLEEVRNIIRIILTAAVHDHRGFTRVPILGISPAHGDRAPLAMVPPQFDIFDLVECLMLPLEKTVLRRCARAVTHDENLSRDLRADKLPVEDREEGALACPVIEDRDEDHDGLDRCRYLISGLR